MLARFVWDKGAATSAALVPTVVLMAFLALMIAWSLFALPTPEEQYALIADFFAEHGSLAVCIAAFVEGIAVINFYAPGSAVILLGVSTSSDVGRAAEVVMVTMLGFIVSAHVNWALGRFGLQPLLYRVGGRRWLQRSERTYAKHGPAALLWSYFHPNLGGVLAVVCGAAGLPWRRFVGPVVLAVLVWNSFWGIIAYSLSSQVRQVATSPKLVLSALGIWLILAFLTGGIRRKVDTPRPEPS